MRVIGVFLACVCSLSLWSQTQAVPDASSCCSTNQQIIEAVIPHLQNLRTQLDSGELAMIHYRVGRAVMNSNPKLGREYLISALKEASIAPDREIVIDTTGPPSTDAQRLQLFYSEFLRKQQTVQNGVLSELLRADFANAVDQVRRLSSSTRGYQKLKYGDITIAVPPERNTNTQLVCTAAQTLASKDLDAGLKLFIERFHAVEEPVFLPAIRLFDFIAPKNQVAGEKIEAAIKERALELLTNGDIGTVIQTHISLSRALADSRSSKLVGDVAGLSVANITETTGADLPAGLQMEFAHSLQQYLVTLRRYPELREIAKQYEHHRDRILKRIGVSPEEFEKRQLTVESSQDPKKFALAMSYRSQEFANQILAQTEFPDLSKVTTEELETKYQQSKGYRKFNIALKLNEKVYSISPTKAEKYLWEARTLCNEENNTFQRILMQSVLYAQGINRCSKETLATLANDPFESASSLLAKHDSNRKEEAVFISTLLSPFIMEYGQFDLAGALKTISRIPDPWIQADLDTVVLESSLAQKK